MTSVASAHLGHIVLSAERYLKMDAASDEVRLVVSLTLGPTEGRRVLEAADGDGDGTVTRAEADAYMAKWGEGLETDLPVTVDGHPVQVAWGEPYLEPIGRVQPTRANVEMVAHVPLERGQHTVAMRDRMRVEVFDRTDVAFRAHGGARLVASGWGERPSDPTPALAFGPDLPRPEGGGVLTAVYDIPGSPDEDDETAGSWPLWAAGGGALLLAVVAWIAVLRRTRRKSASSDRKTE